MKRQLNKIIFIGSAFNYAEINLDGHTCIVGSNGVGKSTLLRAITFFYYPTNYKKDLGIPDSSQTFAQYYFDGLSYLIYEVKTEDGYFHIIFYKKDNLELAYRFVDVQYDQKYYIENFDSNAPNHLQTNTEKKNILQVEDSIHRIKADGIFCSDEFSGSYKDYKAIIYGNYYASKKEKLRQFYLLKGTEKSHQIPTVIKDILLFSNANVTKLVGAKFVKEFIANTVADRYEDEAAGKKRDFVIDLRQMQTDLEKFTRKYQDIIDFRNPNNQKLRDIIKQQHQTFRQLKQTQKELILDLGGLAKYRTEEQVLLTKEIAEIEQKIEKLTQEFAEQKATFGTVLENLTNQTAEAKVNYDKAVKAAKMYESAEFQSKLKTAAEKETLNQDLKAKQAEFAILSSVFSEIESKYKTLFGALQNEKDNFVNQQSTKNLQIEKVFNEEKMRINETQLTEKQRIVEKFATDKKLYAEEISAAKSELATFKGYYKLIEQTNYFAADLASLQKEKDLLVAQDTQNKNMIALNAKEIEKLQAEYQNFAEKIDNFLVQEEGKTKQKIASLQTQIEAISSKLAIHSTSLYGYLSANMPDWKETVGKIFQENILFRTDLTPKIVENFSQDFYGLQLDLTQLEVLAKSLEDYENDKISLQNQINVLQNDLLKEKEAKNKEKQEKSVAVGKKKKEIADENLLCEQNIEKAMHRKEAIAIQAEEFVAKAKQRKQAELNQNLGQQQAKNLEIEEVTKKIQAVDKLIEQEKLAVESAYKEKIAQIELTKSQAKTQIAAESKAKDGYFLEQQSKLNQDKTAELSGQNLDTQKIAGLEMAMKELKNKLAIIQEIEENSTYKKTIFDKEEFADKLPIFRQQYEILQEELKNKKLEFGKIETSYITDIQAFKEESAKKIYQKSANSKDLDYCENNFKTTPEYFAFQLYFEQMPAKANRQNCIDLIGNIQKNKAEIYENNVEFGNSVRKFVGRFEQDNSLGFVLKEETMQGYEHFASYLADFEINQRIEDTQRETKNLTKQLIDLIHERTESLLSKKQEVFKKVREINHEINHSGFIEAGLIDYFEMKPLDTDNLIIQKMQQLALFKNDLFSVISFEPTQDNKPNDTQKLIDLLNSLHENIKQSKESSLSLQDVFEINFSFKEGRNEVSHKTDLDSIGSNGTTTLIKTIIYIALLYSFSKLSGQRFILHCILDEVGTISANNLKKLLEYAESRNIFLVNALPNSAKLHEMYKYTWNMYKDGLGEQKISLLIATKAKLQ
jgi:energy-coupling factor transporter ATP-binding protein EcfA2